MPSNWLSVPHFENVTWPLLFSWVAAMDEPDFMRILRENLDNDVVRLAYRKWLQEVGDNRAEYIRLMSEHLQVQEKLAELEGQLETHKLWISSDWLDVVFPLRVRSPTVGRCYTIPQPDAVPLVAVGTFVTPDTFVCLIEALSILNEITAGVHGVIAEVLVANGEAVENNQTLFRINRTPRPIAGG